MQNKTAPFWISLTINCEKTKSLVAIQVFEGLCAKFIYDQGWAIPCFGQQYYTGHKYVKLYNTLYQYYTKLCNLILHKKTMHIVSLAKVSKFFFKVNHVNTNLQPART